MFGQITNLWYNFIPALHSGEADCILPPVSANKWKGTRVRKIDVFNHIWPEKYYRAVLNQVGTMTEITKRSGAIPMMVDLDVRFRVMDEFEDDQQILSLAAPPLEVLGGVEVARELSRIGSDGMADLCTKYPSRFPGFIASIAMIDAECAVEEARRAVEDLGACGIQIYTNVSG